MGSAEEPRLAAFFDVLLDPSQRVAGYQFLDLYVSLVSESLKLSRDIEQGLIIAVFLRDFVQAQLHVECFGQIGEAKLTSFKVSELERNLGIPRETLRRKLLLLETQGFLEKSANEGWKLRRQDGRPVIHLKSPHVVESVVNSSRSRGMIVASTTHR